MVAGNLDSKELMRQIKEGNGTATLTTVAGEPLKVMKKGRSIVLEDVKGGTAKVTIADVRQSNGVIHVIDSVLMP